MLAAMRSAVAVLFAFKSGMMNCSCTGPVCMSIPVLIRAKLVSVCDSS